MSDKLEVSRTYRKPDEASAQPVKPTDKIRDLNHLDCIGGGVIHLPLADTDYVEPAVERP